MPLLDRPWIVATAVVYLAAVLAIGVWSARRTRNARDFWVAGQAVGPLVTGLATMAAAFSGFVFLGGPGLTYRIGLTSLFINASVGFTSGLLGWTVAKRLRLLAEAREVYTIADAIGVRYGSRAAAGTAAVAILVGTVSYLGVQLLALGRLLEPVLGLPDRLGSWSFPVALAIGLGVLLFYSVVGGMVAGVYTDVLQGTLMMVAAVLVFGYAMASGGGLGAITASITGAEGFGRTFLEPFGTTPVATAFGFFFVFGVGVLGQPHMLHKFYMLRDPRHLRWVPFTVGFSQILCLLIWLGVGLAVPALVAQGRLAPLERPDDAAPLFLLNFTPDAVAGLAIAGILAAVMSTADSFMNIGSAVLVRDLPRAFGRPVRDELLWGRVATVAVTLGATALAWVYGDLIALLGTFAFGTFGAALAPALAVGLNWKRVTAPAATASIATGMVLNLLLELWNRGSLPGPGKPPFAPGVLPAAVSLAASFTVLFAVTAWQSRGRGEPPLPEDVRAVMEA